MHNTKIQTTKAELNKNLAQLAPCESTLTFQ